MSCSHSYSQAEYEISEHALQRKRVALVAYSGSLHSRWVFLVEGTTKTWWPCSAVNFWLIVSMTAVWNSEQLRTGFILPNKMHISSDWLMYLKTSSSKESLNIDRMFPQKLYVECNITRGKWYINKLNRIEQRWLAYITSDLTSITLDCDCRNSTVRFISQVFRNPIFGSKPSIIRRLGLTSSIPWAQLQFALCWKSHC